MPKDKKLRFGTGIGGWPDDAKLMASMLLLNDIGQGVAMEPEVGEKKTATISGLFFEAGRFEQCQFAKSVEHLGKARA